jgi:hypothetical protein
MRKVILKDEVLFDALQKKEEVVKSISPLVVRMRELESQMEACKKEMVELETKAQPFGMELEKYKSLAKKLTLEHLPEIALAELEEINTVKIEGGEIVADVYDVVETYKENYLKKKYAEKTSGNKVADVKGKADVTGGDTSSENTTEPATTDKGESGDNKSDGHIESEAGSAEKA